MHWANNDNTIKVTVTIYCTVLFEEIIKRLIFIRWIHIALLYIWTDYKKKKKTIIFIIYRRMHVESKGKQINYIYYRLSQLIIESLQ